MSKLPHLKKLDYTCVTTNRPFILPNYVPLDYTYTTKHTQETPIMDHSFHSSTTNKPYHTYILTKFTEKSPEKYFTSLQHNGTYMNPIKGFDSGLICGGVSGYNAIDIHIPTRCTCGYD